MFDVCFENEAHAIFDYFLLTSVWWWTHPVPSYPRAPGSILQVSSRGQCDAARGGIAGANAIEFVDLVVGQQEYTPFTNVRNIAPNILMESESHDNAQIEEGRKLMAELGGSVIVLPYFQGQSSTSIKTKIAFD